MFEKLRIIIRRCKAKFLAVITKLFSRKEKSFLSYFRSFLNDEVKSKKLSVDTARKYDGQYKNVESFLRSRKQLNITLDKIRIAHMDAFYNWMHKNLTSCSKTHAAKHIESVKRCLDYAARAEVISHNPIAAFKTKRDKVKPVIWLDPPEIARLKAAKFVNEIYNLHRDLYLYQCFTGLSYMDLWRHEIRVEKGIAWVTSTAGRGKTQKMYWAEFTPEAKEIYDRYGGKFPTTDNRTYNRIIKEIMAQVGIKKYITTHTGRKTFATLKDQEGYSLGSIAGMLGNTEEITRRHYVDPTLEKVKAEVLRVRQNGITQSAETVTSKHIVKF